MDQGNRVHPITLAMWLGAIAKWKILDGCAKMPRPKNHFMRPIMALPTEKLLKTGRAMVAVQGRLIRDILVPTLKQMGATNILFGSGVEILAQAREFEPEIIFCEYAMDVVNGEAFLRQLRKGFGMTTPVVVMVNRQDGAAQTKAKAAGATDTLDVPFAVGDVLKVTKKALSNGGAPKKLYFGE